MAKSLEEKLNTKRLNEVSLQTHGLPPFHEMTKQTRKESEFLTMRTESGMRNLWKHVFEQHVISRASVQSLTIHFPSLSQIFWFPLHSNFVAPGAWNCRRRKRSTSLWSNRFNCLRNRQERQNHGHLDGAAFCLKMYFAKRRLSVVVKHKNSSNLLLGDRGAWIHWDTPVFELEVQTSN